MRGIRRLLAAGAAAVQLAASLAAAPSPGPAGDGDRLRLALPGRPATAYSSRQAPSPEDRDAAAALATAAPDLAFSPGLARAARIYASTVDEPLRNRVPEGFLDFALRAAGCPDPSAVVGMVFSTEGDAAEMLPQLAVLRASMPAPPTHVGAARVADPGARLPWRWAVIMVRREAFVEPFPRSFRPGRSWPLAFSLEGGLGDPSVVVLRPGGETVRVTPRRHGDLWVGPRERRGARRRRHRGDRRGRRRGSARRGAHAHPRRPAAGRGVGGAGSPAGGCAGQLRGGGARDGRHARRGPAAPRSPAARPLPRARRRRPRPQRGHARPRLRGAPVAHHRRAPRPAERRRLRHQGGGGEHLARAVAGVGAGLADGQPRPPGQHPLATLHRDRHRRRPGGGRRGRARRCGSPRSSRCRSCPPAPGRVDATMAARLAERPAGPRRDRRLDAVAATLARNAERRLHIRGGAPPGGGGRRSRRPA